MIAAYEDMFVFLRPLRHRQNTFRRGLALHGQEPLISRLFPSCQDTLIQIHELMFEGPIDQLDLIGIGRAGMPRLESLVPYLAVRGC